MKEALRNLGCVSTVYLIMYTKSLAITVAVSVYVVHNNFLGVLRFPSMADYDNLNYFRSRISILNDGSLLAGAL